MVVCTEMEMGVVVPGGAGLSLRGWKGLWMVCTVPGRWMSNRKVCDSAVMAVVVVSVVVVACRTGVGVVLDGVLGWTGCGAAPLGPCFGCSLTLCTPGSGVEVVRRASTPVLPVQS
mmetsp:Transcript_59183/g.168275  ORF Transcript_59183/g.168275 Transcript_59183/m.168275 type:complete len:116 (+) Transcript_59183:252-599(+)